MKDVRRGSTGEAVSYEPRRPLKQKHAASYGSEAQAEGGSGNHHRILLFMWATVNVRRCSGHTKDVSRALYRDLIVTSLKCSLGSSACWVFSNIDGS